MLIVFKVDYDIGVIIPDNVYNSVHNNVCTE